jgi:hypothetical protein
VCKGLIVSSNATRLKVLFSHPSFDVASPKGSNSFSVSIRTSLSPLLYPYVASMGNPSTTINAFSTFSIVISSSAIGSSTC